MSVSEACSFTRPDSHADPNDSSPPASSTRSSLVEDQSDLRRRPVVGGDVIKYAVVQVTTENHAEVDHLCADRTVETLGPAISRAGQPRGELGDRRFAFLGAGHASPLRPGGPADGAAPRLPQPRRVDRYRGQVDDDSMAEDANDSTVDSTIDSTGESVSAGTDDEAWIDGVEVDAATDADLDAPEPTTWARPDATGVASVDAAIGELDGLDALPTSEHVAVYEGLHRQLQDALADLDGA